MVRDLGYCDGDHPPLGGDPYGADRLLESGHRLRHLYRLVVSGVLGQNRDLQTPEFSSTRDTIHNQNLEDCRHFTVVDPKQRVVGLSIATAHGFTIPINTPSSSQLFCTPFWSAGAVSKVGTGCLLKSFNNIIQSM